MKPSASSALNAGARSFKHGHLVTGVELAKNSTILVAVAAIEFARSEVQYFRVTAALKSTRIIEFTMATWADTRVEFVDVWWMAVPPEPPAPAWLKNSTEDEFMQDSESGQGYRGRACGRHRDSVVASGRSHGREFSVTVIRDRESGKEHDHRETNSDSSHERNVEAAKERAEVSRTRDVLDRSRHWSCPTPARRAGANRVASLPSLLEAIDELVELVCEQDPQHDLGDGCVVQMGEGHENFED
jgi:hypothetical protein